MEYKIVQILSSREFYKMVDVLNEIVKPDELCILDFTDVVRIDAVVIPNLLLLGKQIEKKTKNIPYIRLGEDLRSGYLKKYLQNIRFYELSGAYYYYENDVEKYGGLIGKEMDKRNTTECFLLDEGIVIAQRRLYYKIYPFIVNYLKAFNIKKTGSNDIWDENTFRNNLIAKFLKEMIDNSFKRGKSDVIITVQTNYKKEKIYLSIADSGRGFLSAMLQNMGENGDFLSKEEDDPGYNILGRRPKDEREAIFVGIYKRMYSQTYGLYNVIKNILELKGIIRIHSNDMQLILTERLKEQFLQATLINNMRRLEGYNIVKTSCFSGAHIEIELPISILDIGRGGNSVYN